MASLLDDAAGIEEVAAALGRRPGWLRRNWLKIHQREGFPRRHATGWTWPRRAVAAWLASGGAAPRVLDAANDDAFSSADPAVAYMAALNAHYGVEA